jgi:hypothetical protein
MVSESNAPRPFVAAFKEFVTKYGSPSEPTNWPPLTGDLWRSKVTPTFPLGQLWLACYPTEFVEGEPDMWMQSTAGGKVAASVVLEMCAPLTLVHREGVTL